MKIACIQMDIAFGEPEKNRDKVIKFTEEAAQSKADVIVFPEMWNIGYALDQMDQLADRNGEKTKQLLIRLAKNYQVNIIGGSVATKKGNQFYNTMYGVNRKGEIVSDYDKVHLFQLMDEHLYLEKGQSLNIFEIDNICCGGVICYDIRFPEWIRTHSVKGTKIMFVVAQWPKKRIDHWQLLLRARAIENQCFVVAVNRVGFDPNNEFNGHSMVISPWGKLLIGNETKEGVFYTNLEIQEVDLIRQSIPVFQDRRRDLY
ncbi:carbon-nitrogen family hydrolase [Heyndrickxia oleronia]|uniref:carbon-nitrogen family hydrolase n=1 Tax=Heyndrickxia oleronia TaxID=38875 RepID=UPI001B0C6EE4|nr:carbon-nitrogen family hydrolase [Heyndrickxia oleronia]GIN41121.1 hydrolase [Heyndrickxia oleronia]